MDVLRDQNWLLSVGTFLPLAGVLVLLFIPKAEEQMAKLVALVTAGATLAVVVVTMVTADETWMAVPARLPVIRRYRAVTAPFKDNVMFPPAAPDRLSTSVLCSMTALPPFR